MSFVPFRTTRLHVVAAATEMLLGLSIYVFPAAFSGGSYSLIAPNLPLISAALVGGGVLLLVLEQQLIPKAWRRPLSLIPALPLIISSISGVKSAAWTAALVYGLTALAILATPWVGNNSARDEGLDLWLLTFGVVELFSAGTYLVGPQAYAGLPAYFPLFPYMRLAGAAGLIGGACLLIGSHPRQQLVPDWVMRVSAAIMPLASSWSFITSGYYSGAVIWGTWSIALLAGAGDIGVRFRAAAAVDGSDPDTHPRTLEQLLESWMWLLAFSVVGLTLATKGAQMSVPILSTVFVLAISAYNAVGFRVLKALLPIGTRLQCHFTFIVVSVGLLLLHSSEIGHGFLALLAAVPALATRAVGPRAGYRMLAVAAATVALTYFSGGPEDHGLADTVMEVVLLAVTASVGIQVSAEQRRSAAQLLERQTELEAALAQARAADAEKARLAAILEATPDLVAMVDRRGRRIYLNPAGHQLLELTESDAAGQERALDLVTPQVARHLLRVGLLSVRGGRVWSGEGALVNRSGETIPVSQVIIAHREADGKVQYYSTIQRDIRPQKAAEQALRTSEERFRYAFEEAPIGMALVDLEGQVMQVNDVLCRMLGYKAEELICRGLNGITHSEDANVTPPSDFLSGKTRSYHREKRYVHKDGHTVWGLLSLSLVNDSVGRPAYYIGHIQDITERKSYERQLMHLASYDPLTDLFNRRRFQEELERQLLQVTRRGGQGALMFIDLDQFKYVNDTLGHQAGDEFLRSVANILRQQLRRGTDTVARLGGDEFAVLMAAVTDEEARAMAERILVQCRQHVQVLSGQSVRSTCSIGIALYPDHGITAADLLARADFAMYQAKERGRNRYYVFRPDSDAVGQAEQKLRWEERIRKALEADGLVLFSQPIWNLKENRTSHHELLLRMRGEQGEIIPPGEFLPVAERFGLIHAIDRWVVRQAIQAIAAEARCGRRFVVEVNLSGLAFGDSELLPLIRKELAETRIDPGCLILEITETAAIADLEQARRFVHTLRELGCRFAIDDFGSGFASFAYLKHLPVDYLKIDGSFIENLVRDPVDQHLVKSMVEVARGLGKQTIAEFVGDIETLQMLRDFGVDYAQGYYIGRPAPRPEQSFA